MVKNEAWPAGSQTLINLFTVCCQTVLFPAQHDSTDGVGPGTSGLTI